MIQEAVSSVSLDHADGETRYGKFVVLAPPGYSSKNRSHIIGKNGLPLCGTTIPFPNRQDWWYHHLERLPRKKVCPSCVRVVGGDVIAIYPGESVCGEQRVDLPR